MRPTNFLVLPIAVLLLQFGQSVALSVDSHFPPAQTITAEPSADIVVRFSTPVDPFTVTAESFRVFGRWSGPSGGTFQFEAGDSIVRFIPDEPLFAGEWMTVMLSHDIAGAGGDSLSTGFMWNFWVRTLPGVLDMVELAVIQIRQPDEIHIQSYGAYAGDLNDDGWSDLAIPNEQSNDLRVFLNNGSGMYGAFTIHFLPGANTPSANEGADFNADGFIDLAIGSGGNTNMNVVFGDGAGGFLMDTVYVSGSSVRGIAVIDIDTDGDDDIVSANRFGSTLTLFLNDGTGVFGSAGSFDAGVNGETAVAVTDANGDGIADLFVGGYAGQELAILLGDGLGNLVFSDKTPALGTPWMIAIGDVNGDGLADVACANSLANNCSVAFGDGLGGLLAATTFPGGTFPLAIDLGDLDGDGDLDMVTSSYSSADFRVFANDGSGGFAAPIIYPSASAGSCATLHDRDNDGDLDMSVIDEIQDLLFIYNNTCCDGTTGNVDDDAGENVNLTDVTLLVNHLFVTFESLPCLAESNVNGDPEESISLTDLTTLINHLFVSFEPLPNCP
jgi:hypothetical protein